MGSFVISLSKPLVFFHMHFKGGKKGVLSKVYPAYFWLLLIVCMLPKDVSQVKLIFIYVRTYSVMSNSVRPQGL